MTFSHSTPSRLGRRPLTNAGRALCLGFALLAGTAPAATYTLGSGTASPGDPFGTSSLTNPLTDNGTTLAGGWYVTGDTTTRTAPVAQNDYVVATTSTTANNALRTPADGNTYTFPGATLTINPGGRFLFKGSGTTQTVTVNNLTLNGGLLDQAFATNDGFASTLLGTINVTAASTVGALAGETFTLGSQISGSGALTFSGAGINAGQDTGTVIVNGAVAKYAGLLTLAGGTLDVRADGGLGQGNVTLTAGTLRLNLGATNNYLGDRATLTIASGATANLNFTGTDNVGSLVVNGTTLGPGTYSAANEAGFLTGTGSITVVPEPSASAGMALGGLAGAVLRRRRRAAVAL